MICQTAEQWAKTLNDLTAAQAEKHGVDLHSSACELMTWSVIQGTLAGVRYADTRDAIVSGDMTAWDFLSLDGRWLVTWDKQSLSWKNVTVTQSGEAKS